MEFLTHSKLVFFCFFFLLQTFGFVKLSEEGGEGGGGKGMKEVRLLRIPETRA